ncbi:unnamed protein product [Cuscuta europaea]|uniref:Retrotransposable element Tf2 n=1 Tax=Cuscuta europaea TaxID=41803 RepID=A0A9P0ZNC6_CUSEU|nr:unnamed protein product [Cuscuta europaea]
MKYNTGGRENVVADALSRVQGAELCCLAISLVDSDLEHLIKESYKGDDHLNIILHLLQQNQVVDKYSMQNGLIRRKGKIVIGDDISLKQKILMWHHASGEVGHSGRDATIRRIKTIFYWKGLNKEVSNFIRNCVVCQTNKHENVAYPGLLQPLPIPEEVWVDISLDFITGLPKSGGKEVILVVVDRLSKAAHFVALAHPFTAIEVAQAYLDNIFKLHGWPKSIVSDRDAIFLSQFWKGLFSIQGTQFKLSSTYHPQTDGQTEIVNKCLESYLRCMCSERPKEWSFWLPLAGWWFNTHFQTSAGTTPYEIMYTQPPPLHLPYFPRESNVEAVDRSMQRREEMLKRLKENLVKAQSRMKQMAHRRRSETEYLIGDWVWLKLQHYRQQSVQPRSNQKLATRFFGPFQIKEVIGKVAYKLKLPSDSQIHDVFHVSQLKKFRGKLPIAAHIPAWFSGQNAEFAPQPEKILERRSVKFQDKVQVQLFIQWKGFTVEEATWESTDHFREQYPKFDVSRNTT